MKSIKLSISLSIIICTFITSAVIGVMSIYNARNMSDSSAEKELILTCENVGTDINAMISRVEQSVNTVTDIALSRLEVSKMKNNPEYVKQYTDELLDDFIRFSENTDGAIAAYVRYNPDFTEPTSGIFLTRNSTSEPFTSVTPTDFSIYDKDDLAHVGWYYIPVANKAPLWMDPYLNENINVYMISYVVPLYVNGESIGVIGMDIDFNQITGISDSMSVFKSGYAFIVSESGAMLHHKEIETGTQLSAYNGGELAEMEQFLADSGNAGELFEYTLNGEKERMVFCRLNNGMRLVLTATYMEVIAGANAITYKIWFFFAVAVAIAVILGIVMSNYIANPINQLTGIIKRTADLDLREYNAAPKLLSRKDETGTMARAIRDMRSALRDLVSSMSNIKANLDVNMETLDSIMQQNNSIAEDNSATTEELAAGMQEAADNSSRIVDNISAIQNNVVGIQQLSKDGQKRSEEIKSRAKQLSASTQNSSDQTMQMYRDMQVKTAAAIEQSKVVSKINELTEAIREISSQTNLLALNANIEAARAGDAGRGFAVVATEIGSLANQTFQTVDGINEIVVSVNEAVKNMTNCIGELMQFLDQTIVKDYESFLEVGEKYEEDANSFSKDMESIYGEIAELNKRVDEITNAIAGVQGMISQSSDGVTFIAEKSSDTVEKNIDGYRNLHENKEKLNSLGEVIGRFEI